MSSGISNMLKQAAEACAKEMQKEEDKKVKIALQKTANKVEEKLDEILKEDMVEAYYAGYDPLEYIRTHQLGKAVKSYTDLQDSGAVSGFAFGAMFDAGKMNHRKKQKRKKVKIQANESIILENFQDGVHPNAVAGGLTGSPNAIPLFTDDKEGSVPDIIEEWVDNGGIVDIFLDELSKLH